MRDVLSDPLLPKTTYSGMLTDSRLWAQFAPRAGDVIVSTPPKSGTTWMQGILALLFSGDPDVDAKPSVRSPWFDHRFNLEEKSARLAAQEGRRHVKTHTPLDGVPIWDEVRYISVYRHPIDVHFSSRRHVANYSPGIAEEFGITEDRFPSDPRKSFRLFLDGDDMDHGSLPTIVAHYRRWLEMEPRANLLRLHYADMTRDLAGQMARVAAHVGVTHPPDAMAALVAAATFGNMKANADRFAIVAGEAFWKNDAGFFDSGTSNKWEGVLGDADLAAYDAAISTLLDPEERRWLEWGSA